MTKTELHELVQNYADACVESAVLMRHVMPRRYYEAIDRQTEAGRLVTLAIEEIEGLA